MFARTLLVDPDSNKGHGPLVTDDPAKQAEGDAWRNSIRGYFSERVKGRKIGIFSNSV